MIYLKKIILGILTVLVLTSCSIFEPIKTPQITKFNLNLVPKVTKRESHSLSILVQLPNTVSTYDTTQMIYTDRRNQIASYEVNEWANRPAQMLHPLIVETLENTGYFKAVYTPPHVGIPDLILSTYISKLHINYLHPRKTLVFTVHAQLVDAKTNQVIEARRFTVVEPIRKATPENAAFAANRATEKILHKLSRFNMF